MKANLFPAANGNGFIRKLVPFTWVKKLPEHIVNTCFNSDVEQISHRGRIRYKTALNLYLQCKLWTRSVAADGFCALGQAIQDVCDLGHDPSFPLKWEGNQRALSSGRDMVRFAFLEISPKQYDDEKDPNDMFCGKALNRSPIRNV